MTGGFSVPQTGGGGEGEGWHHIVGNIIFPWYYKEMVGPMAMVGYGCVNWENWEGGTEPLLLTLCLVHPEWFMHIYMVLSVCVYSV